MKRIIALAVASVLTLSTIFALSSCGNENTAVDISSATSVADLAGARIAAQAGTFHETARTQIADVKGTIYEDFDSMLVALKSGVIDGYIAEEPTAFVNCMKDSELDYVRLVNNDNGFTADAAETAIAIGCKTDSPLVAQINAILADVTEAQKAALMNEAFAVNAGETVATYTLSNTAATTENGTLKVAMECAYDPFNWTQTDDANGAVLISGTTNQYANGYDVQIAKYVANALGMKLEIYAVEWDSLITGVQAGTYDAIIAGMSPTAEREEEIDFTDYYYTSNLVVIYKK